MNKDNKLDLVLTCSNGSVAVLLGNGDGSFQGPAYYAVSGLKTLAPPVDLNGDGYLDAAVSSLLGRLCHRFRSAQSGEHRSSHAFPGLLGDPVLRLRPG